MIISRVTSWPVTEVSRPVWMGPVDGVVIPPGQFLVIDQNDNFIITTDSNPDDPTYITTTNSA